MTDEIQKRGRGRPTKYKPEYCDLVEKHMGQGLSLMAFAGILGVARSTIQEWCADQPEFAEAVDCAKAQRLLHWERAALKVATHGGGPGTAQIIAFGLKNMGGDEWHDTNRTEISGPKGGPVQTEEVSARDIIAGKLARGAPRS